MKQIAAETGRTIIGNSAQADNWSGIFAIVITPFSDTLELDEEGLRKQIELCVQGGVRGIVGPANASEFTTLSDRERRRWLEIAVSASEERVPVIASITSGHEVPAVELGKFAQGLGAAGVMSMPPPLLPREPDGCFRYYEHLSKQLNVPVIVQNYGAPPGTPMSAGLLARVCRELEGVDYIKEEVVPEPQRISATLSATGADCKGIFGGQGGIFLIDEYLRGASGNMPGSHNADLLASIWTKLEQGADEEARALFSHLLPLMGYERLYGLAVYKEILVRRRLISTANRRAPGPDLDAFDRAELDRILGDLSPLLNL